MVVAAVRRTVLHTQGRTMATCEHTHVRLISAEGFVFVVETRAACMSKTISSMLSSEGASALASDRGPLLAVRCSAQVLLTAHQAASPRQSWAKSGFQTCVHEAAIARCLCASRFTDKRTLQISTAVLEKVCQYFHYKLKYNDRTSTDAPIPEFPIAPEIVLQLLMVCALSHERGVRGL